METEETNLNSRKNEEWLTWLLNMYNHITSHSHKPIQCGATSKHANIQISGILQITNSRLGLGMHVRVVEYDVPPKCHAICHCEALNAFRYTAFLNAAFGHLVTISNQSTQLGLPDFGIAKRGHKINTFWFFFVCNEKLNFFKPLSANIFKEPKLFFNQ